MDNEGVLNLTYAFNDNENVLDLEEKFDETQIRAIKSSCTSIIFPRNVEIIAEEAFESFTNLRKVKIPASVRQIEKKAFANCKLLESIEFEDKQGDPDLFIGEEAFINAGIKNKKPIPSIIIPNRCEWIDHNSFKNVNTSIISIPIFEITFDSFESFRSGHPLYLFIRLDLDDEDTERDDIKIALNSFNNKEVLCFFNVFDRDPNNPKTTSEVFIMNEKKEIEKKVFSTLDTSELNFEGLDLRGLRLKNVELKKIIFDKSVLIADTFENVLFQKCTFKNTEFLNEKDIINNNLRYANNIFNSCNFSNAILNDVQFYRCKFNRDIIDSNIEQHYFEGTKFNGTNFSNNCKINDEMLKYDYDFNILNCNLPSLPKNVIKYYYTYLNNYLKETEESLLKIEEKMSDVVPIITSYLIHDKLEKLKVIYNKQNSRTETPPTKRIRLTFGYFF